MPIINSVAASAEQTNRMLNVMITIGGRNKVMLMPNIKKDVQPKASQTTIIAISRWVDVIVILLGTVPTIYPHLWCQIGAKFASGVGTEEHAPLVGVAGESLAQRCST